MYKVIGYTNQNKLATKENSINLRQETCYTSFSVVEAERFSGMVATLPSFLYEVQEESWLNALPVTTYQLTKDYCKLYIHILHVYKTSVNQILKVEW